VEHLDGSGKAKERLRVILETLMGQCRVPEACARLQISEQRFRQLRAGVLRAALARLEDRPAGRPRRPEAPAEAVALREQVTELQHELQVAAVREEIALGLPQVKPTPPEPAGPRAAAPKKKRQRQC
jgi:hypothetical protein